MLVHCFVVKFVSNKKINIDELHKEFGENIPKYLQYEGGTGCNYLCCVDAKIDVIEICKKYDLEICSSLYTMKIEEEKYNNSYTIHPTYSREGNRYYLSDSY